MFKEFFGTFSKHLLYNIILFVILGVYLFTVIVHLDQKHIIVKSVIFRFLYGISGSFSIMTACASSLLETNPRFLLAQKRTEVALYSLRHMFSLNSSQHWEKYNVTKYFYCKSNHKVYFTIVEG